MHYLGLFWWLLIGIFALAIWQRVAPSSWRIGHSADPDASKFSGFAVVFSVLLTLTVVFLFTQIWNDLASWMQPSPRISGADTELQLIFVHTAFVIPVVILALVVVLLLHGRSNTYAVVTLPYFIGAVMIAVRLLFDVGAWVISEYQKTGIYAVLIILLIIFSIIAAVVQHWWQNKRPNVPAS